jgi:hypothetical protein
MISSRKPYKIRNMTMKNLVENASKNPMLNWGNEGGGGRM